MADLAFRDYLPYHKNSVETPIVVTDDDPIWTEFNTLAIGDNLPAGEYTITLSWSWAMADINDTAIFRVVSPLTSGAPFRYEPHDVNEFRGNTVVFPETHLGGPITILLEASKTLGAEDLTIAVSHIQFERKA